MMEERVSHDSRRKIGREECRIRRAEMGQEKKSKKGKLR